MVVLPWYSFDKNHFIKKTNFFSFRNRKKIRLPQNSSEMQTHVIINSAGNVSGMDFQKNTTLYILLKGW